MKQRYKKFFEDDYPQVEVGDEVLGGKFKNKRMIIQDFGTDENDQPTIKTDKGEKKLYAVRIPKKEEIEPGFVVDYFDPTNKYLIRRIENLAELKAIKGSPRIVIANNDAYVSTDGGFNIIHEDILNYLYKRRIIKVNPKDWHKSAESLKYCLCLHYVNGIAELAESYWDEAIIEMNIEEKYQLLIQKHLKVLDKLNIKYDV